MICLVLANLLNIKLASDLNLRRKGGEYLGDALIEFAKNNPGRSFYLFTFTHDIGNTSDREPVIELKAMQSRMDVVFRQYGLSSFSVIEMQGIGNHPAEGRGRTIMVHGHACVWSDQSFDHKQAMGDLNSSSAWANELNDTPVHIKPIQARAGDLAYVAGYLLKPPYDVKMMEDRKNGIRLKSVEKGYKPEFAVRILEGMSQLELFSLVRSTSEGAELRKNWQRRLTYWHKSRTQWQNDKVIAVDLSDFWSRIRTKKKRVSYLPYIIKR